METKVTKSNVLYIINVSGEATGVTETMKQVTSVTQTHQVSFQNTSLLIKLFISFVYTMKDEKLCETALINEN